MDSWYPENFVCDGYKKIPDYCQVRKHKDLEGCCMWLSATLMVYIDNKAMAHKIRNEIMSEKLGRSIYGNDFNHSVRQMYLFKHSPCLSIALEKRQL